jgi:hypothetical protein
MNTAFGGLLNVVLLVLIAAPFVIAYYFLEKIFGKPRTSSIQQQPEGRQLQWSRAPSQWTYAPLVAFAILSLWPSAALVVGMLLGDRLSSEWILGTVVVILLSAAANWAFVYLYSETRERVEHAISQPIGSVRIAMWSSLLAMAIPNAASILFLFWATYGQRNQGVAPGLFLLLLLFCFAFILPIFGLIGWFAGRALYKRKDTTQSAAASSK